MKLRHSLLLCLAWGGAALAAPPADYAQRYASNCAACHGAQGHSTQAGTPSLGGQPPLYAITQLYLFRAGRRSGSVMNAISAGFSDADLRGYAALIGTLPAPAAAQAAAPADPARMARGQATAQRHQCLACHGADGGGGKQVPRLALQREEYLRTALAQFKAGTRIGYTQAMSEALSDVAPGELDDLAHFLAHYTTAP
jgi:cytochrome c553